jgi:alpha-L-arabinofuranosidase
MSTVRTIVAAMIAVSCLVGCSSDSSSGFKPTVVSSVSNDASVTGETSMRDGSITIIPNGATSSFDRRLLGTNAPAWIGPKKLADPSFQRRIEDLGTTVIRMPGGSWSSSYNWLACENRDATGCYWTWAARPSDYADFLGVTGVDGMWTVNINSTSQSAAALVAFFNGTVGDNRAIGVDRNGQDWGTFGQWATLRATNGHPAPQPVKYWEIGNEVYGAKAASAPGCASFGWEDAWTCDGGTYVTGDGTHDGFSAFRAAMRLVDPTIMVGAVGIGGDQREWNDFGQKVISKTAGALDFYIVHDYGFSNSPSKTEVLERPEQQVSKVVEGPRRELAGENVSVTVPIAVTEYNLFAFADGDTTGMMSQSIDALYVADTIGQMAAQGVQMADHWNLVNGANKTGSDYGMLDPDTSAPKPQFFGLALWSRFGTSMVPVTVGFDSRTQLTAYGGRRDDGTLTLLVINKSAESLNAEIDISGATRAYSGVADVVAARALDSTSMTYNGATLGDDPLAAHPGQAFESVSGTPIERAVAPFSITLLTLTPR